MNNVIGVIGVGSSFGADNIAQYVIELLQKKYHIQCDYYDRPGLYLLDYMKDFNCLHLIDAIVSDKPVGTLHRYEDIKDLCADDILLSSHGVGIAEVLSLGSILNCLPEKIIIHGIEIDNDTVMEPRSQDMMKSCDSLANRIAEELKKSLKTKQ